MHNDQNIWLFTNDLRITTKVYDFLTKTLNNDENKRCFNTHVEQRRNDFPFNCNTDVYNCLKRTNRKVRNFYFKFNQVKKSHCQVHVAKFFFKVLKKDKKVRKREQLLKRLRSVDNPEAKKCKKKTVKKNVLCFYSNCEWL